MGETSWLFLLVGSVAALGAAMAFGTLAAIVRYHRTGTFPGTEDPDAAGSDPAAQDPQELPRGRLIALWVRVAIGLVLFAVGLVWLDRAGIL